MTARSHDDEHFGGMSDTDRASEYKAIEQTHAVIEAIRADPGYPRIAGATLIRRAAKLSELRRTALIDFAMALLDIKDLENAIHDYAPNIETWEQEITNV